VFISILVIYFAVVIAGKLFVFGHMCYDITILPLQQSGEMVTSLFYQTFNLDEQQYWDHIVKSVAGHYSDGRCSNAGYSN